MGRRGLIWLVAVVALLIAFFGSFELLSRGVSTAGGDGTAQAATVRDQVVRALQSEERRVGKECLSCVDLGGRRIIKKKKNTETYVRDSDSQKDNIQLNLHSD